MAPTPKVKKTIGGQFSIKLSTNQTHPLIVRSSCLAKLKLRKSEHSDIVNLFACGSSGLIYNSEDNKYVVKVVVLDVFIPTQDCVPSKPSTHDDCMIVTTDEFIKEAKMTKQVSKLGLGAKYIDSFICDVESESQRGFGKATSIKAGFLVTQKLDMTLKEYKKTTQWLSNQDFVIHKVFKLISKLRDKRIALLDLHDENIMLQLNKDKSVKEVLAIDFGNAKILDSQSSGRFNELEDTLLYNLGLETYADSEKVAQMRRTSQSQSNKNKPSISITSSISKMLRSVSTKRN